MSSEHAVQAAASSTLLTPGMLATLSIAILGGLALSKAFSGKRDTRPVVMAAHRHLLPRTPIENARRLVELGHGEKQYVRLGTEQPGGNRIYLIATIRGKRVKKEKLEYAAKCIQRIHPLLRCRLVRVNGQVTLEEDPNLLLNVVVRARSGPETCRQVFHKEAEKVIMEIGEDAKSPHTLWLFQDSVENSSHSDETCEIVLDMSHFAIDGAGLAPLMHEVLKYALDENAELPPYGPWPISHCAALDGFLAEKHSWLQKRFIQLRMLLYYVWVSSSQRIFHLPRRDSWKMREYGLWNTTYCARQNLDVKETQALISRCKERQISVTSAVTAAYLEACAEVARHHIGAGKFHATANICADSRKIYSAPSTDLAPHVYGCPLFSSESHYWDNENNDAEFTWALAADIKQHIKNVTADPVEIALQAYWLPSFFSLQPTHLKAPMLNVSSWCPNAPVQLRYNGEDFAVEDVELLQNLAFTSWVNVSMYTFVGKLNISLLAPVPRFDSKLLDDVFARAKKKVHSLIENNASVSTRGQH